MDDIKKMLDEVGGTPSEAYSLNQEPQDFRQSSQTPKGEYMDTIHSFNREGTNVSAYPDEEQLDTYNAFAKQDTS